MQRERRSRLMPMVKKVAMAVAVKKGIDKFQEARRPQRRSLVGRAAKLGMWAAGGSGLFYAFVSGKLQPLVDKVMGASSTPAAKWDRPESSNTSPLVSSPESSPSVGSVDSSSSGVSTGSSPTAPKPSPSSEAKPSASSKESSPSDASTKSTAKA